MWHQRILQPNLLNFKKETCHGLFFCTIAILPNFIASILYTMKEVNRRQFIATASVLAATPSAMRSMEPAEAGLVHHVFFWLKNKGSVADREKLIEGLKTLAGIKEVKKLLVGTPAATEQRGVVDNSYDVSELMYFENIKAQDAYQVHPIHKAFVEKYSHLWEKVVVYDMQVL